MHDEDTAARAYLAKAISAKTAWRRKQACLSISDKLAILDELKAAAAYMARVRAASARVLEAGSSNEVVFT